MYYRYGGRGIKCLWKNYQDFSRDMKESHDKHFVKNNGDTTLERIDIDKHYCKENCTWIRKGEQMRNTRRSRWVKLRGKKMILKDYCMITGKSYGRIMSRVRRGMALEKAIM